MEPHARNEDRTAQRDPRKERDRARRDAVRARDADVVREEITTWITEFLLPHQQKEQQWRDEQTRLLEATRQDVPDKFESVELGLRELVEQGRPDGGWKRAVEEFEAMAPRVAAAVRRGELRRQAVSPFVLGVLYRLDDPVEERMVGERCLSAEDLQAHNRFALRFSHGRATTETVVKGMSYPGRARRTCREQCECEKCARERRDAPAEKARVGRGALLRAYGLESRRRLRSYGAKELRLLLAKRQRDVTDLLDPGVRPYDVRQNVARIREQIRRACASPDPRLERAAAIYRRDYIDGIGPSVHARAGRRGSGIRDD